MATYGTFVDGDTLKASELNSFFGATTFTPTILQGGTTLATVSPATRGARFIVNKLVIMRFEIRTNNIATSGRIEVALPITAASRNAGVIGSAVFYDDSTTDFYRLSAVQYSTTRVAFLSETTASPTTYFGETNGPTLSVAINDILSGMLVYEAA